MSAHGKQRVVCMRTADGPATFASVTIRCERCGQLCHLSKGNVTVAFLMGVLCLQCAINTMAHEPDNIVYTSDGTRADLADVVAMLQKRGIKVQ